MFANSRRRTMKKDKKTLIICGILGVILLVITGMPIFAWTKTWFKACPAVLFWLVFVALNAVWPLGYFVPANMRGFFRTAGAAMLPLEMTLYPIVIVAAAVWLVTKLSVLLLGIAALVLFIAALVWGFINARSVKTKTYDVILEKNVKAKSFVMLSDLHLGFFTDKYMLKRILPEIKKAQPEFVIIAGDIFDGAFSQLRCGKQIQRDLKKLSAVCPVYACEGNRDRGADEEEKSRFIEEAGITLVKDGIIEKDDVTLVFRRDVLEAERKSAQEILADCDREKIIVVADHNPCEMTKLWDNGADLVLSGHLHGGITFPGNIIAKFSESFSYGYAFAKGHHSVVTSGAGSYGTPVRIFTDNEICCINLANENDVFTESTEEE